MREKLVLVAAMMVDERHLNTGRFRDVTNRCPFEATLGKNTLGAIQNPRWTR